jgi:glycosyltransferase involved in cell wall biosynthesis
MGEATISVIIPVYNGAPYLAEALRSVQAQRIPASEIIVVDDGSTDGTADLVGTVFPAVRYLHQDNAGAGAARNRGVAAATGVFLAFLDADDLWLEDKLALQLAAFHAVPDTEAVFGQVRQFYSPELDAAAKSRIRCPDGLTPGWLPTTMLARRDAFFRVGLFETNWQVGEGVNWILRAKELNLKTAMLPDLVYLRRLHQTNKGITHRDCVQDRVRILKAHLDAGRRPAKRFPPER